MKPACCATCEHWQPKYKGVGVCIQEGLPNAAFWVAEHGDRAVLLTIAEFHCAAYREVEASEKGTL